MNSFSNLKSLTSNIEAFIVLKEKQAKRALELAAQDLQRVTIKNVSKNSVGTSGIRSRPMDFPFSDLGFLRKTIFAEKQGLYSYKVGSPMSYAKHLEFGTEKMAPRPFLLPSYFQAKPTMLKRFKGE